MGPGACLGVVPKRKISFPAPAQTDRTTPVSIDTDGNHKKKFSRGQSRNGYLHNTKTLCGISFGL
jgi:hypothetical protein